MTCPSLELHRGPSCMGAPAVPRPQQGELHVDRVAVSCCRVSPKRLVPVISLTRCTDYYWISLAAWREVCSLSF